MNLQEIWNCENIEKTSQPLNSMYYIKIVQEIKNN